MFSKSQAWDLNYLRGQTPWDSNKPEPELVGFVKKHFAKPAASLEVGCGTGTNVIFMAKQGFDASGLDISGVATEMAKKKAEKAGVKAGFYTGDVLDLSFMKKKFDFVFDRGCFHHQATGDREKYANNIYNILKSGGRVLLMAMCRKDTKVTGPNKVDKEDIIKAFSKKFKIVEIRESQFEDRIGPLCYVCEMVKD